MCLASIAFLIYYWGLWHWSSHSVERQLKIGGSSSVKLIHTRAVCSLIIRTISCRLVELQLPCMLGFWARVWAQRWLAGGYHRAGWGGSHTASVFSLLEITFLRWEGGAVMQDGFCMCVFIYSMCEGPLKINSVLFFQLSYFKAGLSCILLIRKKSWEKHKVFQSDYFTTVFYFMYTACSVHCLLLLCSWPSR